MKRRPSKFNHSSLLLDLAQLYGPVTNIRVTHCSWCDGRKRGRHCNCDPVIYYKDTAGNSHKEQLCGNKLEGMTLEQALDFIYSFGEEFYK